MKMGTVLKVSRDMLQFICSLEFWRMAVFWVFSLLISYLHLFIQNLFPRNSASYTRCSTAATPTVSKPICIITGATSGLGLAAAHALSKEGFYVILAGRSPHLLSKTVTEIKQWNKDAQLKDFQVDLSSFQSILNFKNSLQQWLLDSNMHSSVQLLINNAGILETSCRLTDEGFDQNSRVPSRILNVTSFTHRSVLQSLDIKFDKETVTGKKFSRSKQYPYAHVYEFSKLCLLLFSYELHRQLDSMDRSRQVSIIAVDPGVVKTNIMREVPLCISHMAFLVLKLLGLLQTPESGISSILDAALAPPEISGVYFFGGKGRTISSSALSYNTKLAEKLWMTSCDLFLELSLASRETSTSVSNYNSIEPDTST